MNMNLTAEFSKAVVQYPLQARSHFEIVDPDVWKFAKSESPCLYGLGEDWVGPFTFVLDGQRFDAFGLKSRIEDSQKLFLSDLGWLDKKINSPVHEPESAHSSHPVIASQPTETIANKETKVLNVPKREEPPHQKTNLIQSFRHNEPPPSGNGETNLVKNTILIILLVLFAVGGGIYTFIRSGEQKNAAAEIAARKEEAKQKTAQARQKEAEAQRAAEAKKAEARKYDAERKRAEADEAAARRAEAEADEKTARSQAREAEEKRKLAEARAREAEHAAKAAADRKAAAEAWARATEATNETFQAKLELAVAARLAVEADTRRQEAANKAEELKKLELDRLIAENNALNEKLRKREEDTRPERSVNDIIAENERRRIEEEAAAAAEEERRLEALREKDYAAYEAEMEKRRKINREGVAAPKARDLTAAERKLKNADGSLAAIDKTGTAALHMRLVAQLEPELRKALREKRAEDADYLLRGLRELVPGYVFKP